MAKLFTREQARTWLRENNLKDGNSIENALGQRRSPRNIRRGDEYHTWLYKVWLEKQEHGQFEEWPFQKDGKKSIRRDILKIPKDTNGEFEPIIVKKHDRTISSELEGMITYLFARNEQPGHRISHEEDLSPWNICRNGNKDNRKILPIAK